MKQLTDKEVNDLQKEIDHIMDSGVKIIRLIEMIDRFLDRREEAKSLGNVDSSVCYKKDCTQQTFLNKCLQGDAQCYFRLTSE